MNHIRVLETGTRRKDGAVEYSLTMNGTTVFERANYQTCLELAERVCVKDSDTYQEQGLNSITGTRLQELANEREEWIRINEQNSTT